MIKKFLPFILVVFVLLIAGCEEEVIVEGPFVGGSNGLTINFGEAAPISEFSSSAQVPVKVVLKNNGEYDLAANSAEVALYGLAMQDYSLSADYKQVSNPISGIKKDFVDVGSEMLVDMGILKYQGQVSNYIEPTLLAKVCYPYRTQASVSACASSRQIVESGGEIVCNVGEEKINTQRVSSSPIQITSFKEELEGIDKVKFKIAIENKGIGDVYSDDLVCSESDVPLIRAEKQEKVKFKVLPEDVTCVAYDGTQVNEGYAKLDQGKKTLTCTMPVENNGASYKREITVYLDFKYTQSTSKQLRILEA